MAEGSVQLVPDSSGKLVRTVTLSIGGQTVHAQAVVIGSPNGEELLLPDADGRLPVTVASLPLPSGAATSAKQDEVIALLEPLTFRKQDTGTYTYFGEAQPGTATAAASWRISRVTNSDGTILFADGNADFDNVWDNRASLSYS